MVEEGTVFMVNIRSVKRLTIRHYANGEEIRQGFGLPCLASSPDLSIIGVYDPGNAHIPEKLLHMSKSLVLFSNCKRSTTYR